MLRETPAIRQAYALAHPLNRADGDISPYRSVRKHATGLHVNQYVMARSGSARKPDRIH